MKKNKLIIGNAGSGKTEKLKSLAENSIQLGQSVCVIEQSFGSGDTPILKYLQTKGIVANSSSLLEVSFLDDYESNTPVLLCSFDSEVMYSIRQDLTGPLVEIFSKFDVILIDGMQQLLYPFIEKDEQDKLVERLLEFGKELFITTQTTEQLQLSYWTLEKFEIEKVER